MSFTTVHRPSGHAVLGAFLALVTFASGATLFSMRVTHAPGEAGWAMFPSSGLGLALFAIGLSYAIRDRWQEARKIGIATAVLGCLAMLAEIWSLSVASPTPFSLAWLWAPSLQSRAVVGLAGLGLLLSEERTTSRLRLALLCVSGAIVTFIPANLALALALDFPEWVIGGSFAALALAPAEQRLLVAEFSDNLALSLRCAGAAAAGLGLLLLAWNAERRAGYPWPRWLPPVTLLLGIWLSIAIAGALWAQEESTRIRLAPDTVPGASTPLPEMALAFGVATAGLLTVVLWQTRRAAEAAEQARLVNRQLQDEIDERRQVQAMLAEREARLRLVLEQVPAIVWTTDRDLRFTSASGAGLSALGMDDSSLLGKAVVSIAEDDAERAFLLERYQLALAGTPQEFELSYGGRDYTLRLEPLRDLAGEVAGVIGIALDITERTEMESQLRHLALHDPLTGLPNRAYLLQHLARLADTGGDAPRSTRPFALLLLDLDGFKQVNDTFGHPAGDRLLVEVSHRLSRSLRSSDLVARLGGDEFVIVAQGADERAALALAERIARELERPIRIDGHAATIRPSTGIAIGEPGHFDPDTLLRDADIALYRAKALGRGRAVVFEPSMYRETVTRTRLEAQLREAFEQEQLSLRFRPVVELASGRLFGFGTEIGWESAGSRIVPAEEIVPLAEDAGIVLPITRWALREAIDWLAEAGARLPAMPALVLELASSEQIRPELADELDRLLGGAGIPPERLILALHGPALSTATAGGIDTLQTLQARGVPLFAGGYELAGAPLTLLTGLPVSGITIAPALVSALDEGPLVPAIVRALVRLAEEMGIATLAQGVSTREQCAALARFGCTLAQGELFGPPADGAAALVLAQDVEHRNLIGPLPLGQPD